MKKSFFDFFPPPKFLENPPVGLDISDDAVRFIELVKGPGGFILGRYGEKELPPGVVGSGYIKDEKTLGKILADLQKEFRLKYVKIALPDEKTYLYKTEIPRAGEENLRESIEFTIEDNVPIPATESSFDFNVIENSDKNKDHTDVVVSVAPQKVVSTYESVLENAGLFPLVLEIESRSIAKAVIEKGDKRTFLILNLEKDKTGLYVVSEGVVHFTSIVNSAIQSLDFSSTEPMDRTRRAFVKGKSAPMFIQEVEKVYDYWETRPIVPGKEKNKIDKIIICGGNLSDAEQAENLGSIFETKTEIANVWTNAFSFDDYIPDIPFGNSLKYASAVGLALP